jgi:hypothetical protein
MNEACTYVIKALLLLQTWVSLLPPFLLFNEPEFQVTESMNRLNAFRILWTE